MLGELCCILLMLTQFPQVINGEEKPNLSISKLSTTTRSSSVTFSIPAEALLTHNFNTSTTKDITHEGRENVDVNSDKTTNSTIVESASITSTIKEPTPTYDVMSEKNDFKSVVAKKGAVFETHTSPMNTTTVPQTTKVAQTTDSPLNKTAEVHINMEEETITTSNIMLPIVGIVVSVPVLGLLFVGFYKCGSEWWQHRHYRRMDFLIDGMYNN